MSALYIHIPFCKQACSYCNFHFSTNKTYRERMIHALCNEIKIRSEEFDGALDSIYLGGGTPSLLDEKMLDQIFKVIQSNAKMNPNAEITLEANPDDLSEAYLSMLRSGPVNRLSIGIQSLDDKLLKLMNRAHSADEARCIVDRARSSGFDALSIDLIFGIPGLQLDDWRSTLEEAMSWEVPHLSAYGLTIEPGTALAYKIKKGSVPAPDENLAAEQMLLLMEITSNYGFEHYEISNYARNGKYAIHNSKYWTGEKYIGIGPSAHSYDGRIRSWNISNNIKYMNAIESGDLLSEFETLTKAEQFNEYILTRLRTMWGLDEDDLIIRFGEYAMRKIASELSHQLSEANLEKNNGKFRLTNRGKLLADHVMASLFLEDEDLI